MSNIYIQEPPSLGKVLLITTVGDIDVELWSKETPKACRNFVQLCMDGYYNGTIFHRVVHDFIAQGGDPTGTGEGGNSIYGQPFKDEIHSRLRFNRRGLVAMANAGKDDNGSQFFFTLNATPELQGKHTIFGKVVGDTIYNMIKLDAETDENERPLHCHKILKTEILNNPFPDIVPRVVERRSKKEKKKEKEKGVKNFKLLSFGEEAEEDEEETAEISKSSKIKSSHDALDDPKLSKAPAVDSKKAQNGDSGEEDQEEEALPEEEKIEEEEINLEGTRERELLRRRAEIQKEIDELKSDYKNRNKPKSEPEKKDKGKKEKISEANNEIFDEYKTNLVKYGQAKTKVPLKGSERESFTMQLLKKFKNKLKEFQESEPPEAGQESVETEQTATEEDVPDDYDGNDGSWMKHTLRFAQNKEVLARDASTKSDDWYEITDPRNPIVKRRIAESKESMKRAKYGRKEHD